MHGDMAIYSIEEVQRYFMDNPRFFDTKRGYEALAGWILARAHQIVHGSQATVGFEIGLSDSSAVAGVRPSVERLFTECRFADRDADVCVPYWTADGKLMINRIQVTRVEERATGDNPYDRLLNVIKKKTLAQTDRTLQLAVLLDEDIDLSFSRLNSELHTLRIPYARICLLYQKGIKPIPNTFVCYEVYPEVAISGAIVVEIGQKPQLP